MKILFMGTPDFARECLRAVHTNENAEIVGVVTQPDKPKGRGMKMIPPPVKVYAEENSLPVYQPTTLKDGAFEEELRRLDPDMIIVAAYGKILPPYVIDYPKFGCINAHASILPRHRGAAPINRAIMEGDRETGVTAMYMDYGLDTGDMILTLTTPITEDDDLESLHDRLAVLGGEAMSKVIDLACKGCVPRTPQPDDGATYAAKITKDDAMLDFSHTAEELCCQIRGLFGGGITHTPDGKLLKVTSAHKGDDCPTCECGTVLSTDNGEITVSCCDGSVCFTGVIPEGKGRMSAADYIRGRKIAKGDHLE